MFSSLIIEFIIGILFVLVIHFKLPRIVGVLNSMARTNIMLM